MGNNRYEGISGEYSAVKYLESIGYEILETNFTSYSGEIDIVAKDGDYIVFAEVKNRMNLKYGRPIEAITPLKVKKIRKTAEFYIIKNRCADRNMRFDVIEILRGEVTHTKNAF
ncbi:MAG: YraN family protein [Clostridiales bacterium]|jgi:putative endonuclease|nr:YraN family protein [Clostridiales bacterium]